EIPGPPVRQGRPATQGQREQLGQLATPELRALLVRQVTPARLVQREQPVPPATQEQLVRPARLVLPATQEPLVRPLQLGRRVTPGLWAPLAPRVRLVPRVRPVRRERRAQLVTPELRAPLVRQEIPEPPVRQGRPATQGQREQLGQLATP